MAHKVFISYSKENKLIADAACAALEAHRISCWIAPRDPIPGIDWHDQILEAIKDCQIVVLIFSRDANSSKQVKAEISEAFEAEKVIVPFRIDDVEPSGSLRWVVKSTHWLDAITPPMERHIAELCETVSRLAQKSPSAEQYRETAQEACEEAGQTPLKQAAQHEADRKAEEEAARKAREEEDLRRARELAAQRQKEEAARRAAGQAAVSRQSSVVAQPAATFQGAGPVTAEAPAKSKSVGLLTKAGILFGGIVLSAACGSAWAGGTAEDWGILGNLLAMALVCAIIGSVVRFLSKKFDLKWMSVICSPVFLLCYCFPNRPTGNPQPSIWFAIEGVVIVIALSLIPLPGRSK